MGLFGSSRARQANRVLKSTGADDRQVALEVIAATEQVMSSGIGAPSSLGTTLLNHLSDFEPWTNAHAAATFIVMYGYSLRISQRDGGAPPLDARHLRLDLVPLNEGGVDYKSLGAAGVENMERLFGSVLDETQEEDLLPFEPPVWNAIAANTASKAYERLDLPRTVTLDAIVLAMRFGYVIRCLEEQVAESPASLDELGLDSAP